MYVLYFIFFKNIISFLFLSSIFTSILNDFYRCLSVRIAAWRKLPAKSHKHSSRTFLGKFNTFKIRFCPLILLESTHTLATSSRVQLIFTLKLRSICEQENKYIYEKKNSKLLCMIAGKLKFMHNNVGKCVRFLGTLIATRVLVHTVHIRRISCANIHNTVRWTQFKLLQFICRTEEHSKY